MDNTMDEYDEELIKIIRRRPDLLALALQLVTAAKQTGVDPPSENGTPTTK